MSNHLHLVLTMDPEQTLQWSVLEVARRYFQLHPPRRGEVQSGVTYSDEQLLEFVQKHGNPELMRQRLGDLSWFMRSLSEPIARSANREDECTGRFWEGRFKCTRIDNIANLLKAMCYVDLNPVRACQANVPEESNHTSAQARCRARNARKVLAQLGISIKEEQQREDQVSAKEDPRGNPELLRAEALREIAEAQWLSPFPLRNPIGNGQDFTLPEDAYLELLDWTGRNVREDKPGAIPGHLLPILKRLDIASERWVHNIRHYEGMWFRVAGKIEQLRDAAMKAGQRWFRGHNAAALFFVSQPARM